ncbi:glycosyltransferase family 1 protein [Polynucleobacter sp. JS-Fieb-80-E5]|uniref:glycosyltransferase family 4 protein n=1 Tax=Polynucleobacter sp. JS-Fieb-80-E5 TaxID=2081050 RepID=UPI001C0C4BF6|nr:glycosyltransferase family 1 protein [Polynucleobacter sp. JS-Fieb-80-E5]MBU3619936.1 glycosyltransferase family 4 protein [Polynucleobacter sp. JS-Fieb-80-E5]
MITIDVRWINSSGIGTYIRHIVPGILKAMPSEQFTLIGNPVEIKQFILKNLDTTTNIAIAEAHSGMYSIKEQFELLRLIPSSTKLYFSPHYPIPLGYQGKLLVTVHDVFHLAMPKLVGGWPKRLYANLMFRFLCNKAAAIITDSDFTRQELHRLVPTEMPPIYPIYLGVDRSWFEVDKKSSPHHKPYLVFVGNIKPNKNLATLVAAYIKILPEISHDLILIGKKSGFITGDSKVAALAGQYPERIIFTDLVSDELLKSYVANASALVFPSLYEGFGLPPLEAMACGCPVIVSDRASLPEVCGHAAIYCNPESEIDIAGKILGLTKNETMQEDLRQRGLKRAQQFTWERSITQTVDVVRKLLG